MKTVSTAYAVVLGILLGLTSQAHAAVYWGNGSTIGRSNLDLTLANPEFVGSFISARIKLSCGVAVNETHIYWADRFGGVIGRSNLDGTNANYSFITGLEEPCGVALDETYLYWGDGEANTGETGEGNAIGRARLDGSEREDDFISVVDPCGVAVDDQFIYWASATANYVGRAPLDSGIPEPLFVGSDLPYLCGVAVNDEHVFWGSFGDVIGRADLDGSNPDSAFIEGLSAPCSVALDDGHIYWTEYEVAGEERLGRATLDGAVLNRVPVVGHVDCGIATDSVVVPPPGPPPPPPPSACEFSIRNRMRSSGGASIALRGPVQGRIEVLTKGLRWRILTPQAPPWVSGTRALSMRIWPGSKGRVAKGIRTRLRRHGRASVKLRIECHGQRESPTTTARRVWLFKKRPGRHKPDKVQAIRGMALLALPNGVPRPGFDPVAAFSGPTGAELGERPSEVALREFLRETRSWSYRVVPLSHWRLLAETEERADLPVVDSRPLAGQVLYP